MKDLISRQAAIDAVNAMFAPTPTQRDMVEDCLEILDNLPSAQPEIIHCKDCKHHPKDEWFGCPMSHLNEKQRPETAWCWKGERRTDADKEV